MIITLNKDDLKRKDHNVIVHTIELGENDIDIVLEEDIVSYSDDDLENYRQYLMTVADYIISRYPDQHIGVDVLTDIFVAENKPKHDNFIFCRMCPCSAVCVADKALFKRTTYDEYTPPIQYCKKHFIEMLVSNYIQEKLGIDFGVSDLPWERYKALIYTIFGTNTRRDRCLIEN